MATWLDRISVLELSAVRRPANRKRKLHQKADWSAAFVNDLPDSAFLHVAPGGSKDDEGKTTPRTLRHFPVRGPDGKVDLPHLRNALARIPQSKLPGDVKAAATAKARRLLESINKSLEDDMPPLWIPEDGTAELEKAQMPDLQKQAIKAAIAALNASKADMDPAMFKSARAALAKLLGFGKAEKSVTDAVAERDKVAAEDKARLVETVKSAIGKLEGDKPAVNDALAQLGELAGVTPTLKTIDALPAELKAQWEALQKSQATDRAELEALKKSLAEREAAAVKREYIAKAEAMPRVPGKAEALGHLMHVVAGDKDAAATLDALLKSVDEIVEQSDLFRERGGGGNVPTDRSGAFGKVEALAAQLVEKSERPMTREQAVARVLEDNPRLYDEYCRQA